MFHLRPITPVVSELTQSCMALTGHVRVFSYLQNSDKISCLPSLRWRFLLSINLTLKAIVFGQRGENGCSSRLTPSLKRKSFLIVLETKDGPAPISVEEDPTNNLTKDDT